MSQKSVMHVFYGVHMGLAFRGLGEIMEEALGREELKKDELAVFVNGAMTACKVLAAGNVFAYYKKTAGVLTVSEIKKPSQN